MGFPDLAIDRIVDVGAVGAILILSIFALVWLVRSMVKVQSGMITQMGDAAKTTTDRVDSITERFIRHVEDKDARTTEVLLSVSKSMEQLVRRQEDTERLQSARHDAIVHVLKSLIKSADRGEDLLEALKRTPEQ